MAELTEQHVLVLSALDEIEDASGPPTVKEIAGHIETIMFDYYEVITDEFRPTVDALRDLCRMGLVHQTGDPSMTPLWSITPSGHEALKDHG